MKGPGDDVLQAVIDIAGDTLIVAEDLGIIPESVTELRTRHNLPGMAVLHFAFDDENADNPHRPENISKDSVAYTGTHDNDTTMGWWESSSDERKKRVMQIGLAGESPCDTLTRLVMESPAAIAIVPLQDILQLGSEARMNTPGQATGNWAWRFEWPALTEGNWNVFKR